MYFDFIIVLFYCCRLLAVLYFVWKWSAKMKNRGYHISSHKSLCADLKIYTHFWGACKIYIEVLLNAQRIAAGKCPGKAGWWIIHLGSVFDGIWYKIT